MGVDNSHYVLKNLSREDPLFLKNYRGNEKVDSSKLQKILEKRVWLKDTVRFSYSETVKLVTADQWGNFMGLFDDKGFWKVESVDIGHPGA